LVFPAFVGLLGEASGFKMMCVGVRLGKLAMFMVTPFIGLVGVVARMVVLD
jgi:hypothetical protein